MPAETTRIESSVTPLSWIPSEALRGMTKLPFELGMAHYDAPPPDGMDDLEVLRQDGCAGCSAVVLEAGEVAGGGCLLIRLRPV